MAENPFETIEMQTFMRDTARMMGIDYASVPAIHVVEGNAIPNLFSVPRPDVIELPQSLIAILDESEIKALAATTVARCTYTDEEIERGESDMRYFKDVAGWTKGCGILGAGVGWGVEKIFPRSRAEREYEGEIVDDEKEGQSKDGISRRTFVKTAGGATAGAVLGTALGSFHAMVPLNTIAMSRAFLAYGYEPTLKNEGRGVYDSLWNKVQDWSAEHATNQRGITEFYVSITSLRSFVDTMVPSASPQALQRQ